MRSPPRYADEGNNTAIRCQLQDGDGGGSGKFPNIPWAYLCGLRPYPLIYQIRHGCLQVASDGAASMEIAQHELRESRGGRLACPGRSGTRRPAAMDGVHGSV